MPQRISISGHKEYTDALNKWIQMAGSEVPAAMKSEGRQLMQRVVKFTPPAGGDKIRPKKQGEDAIRAQLPRAVFPLRAKAFTESNSIRRAIETHDYQALNEIVRQFKPDHPAYNATVVPFNPDLHHSQRDRRGRISMRINNARYATPDVQAWDGYLRARLKMVGQAKGGWANAISQLGGSPAQWIARHKAVGRFRGNLDRKSFNPFFDAENHSRWASGGDQDRIVSNAVRARTRDLVMKIERAIDKTTRQSGLA